jgi:DNA-binding transcriptional MerR regulator/effector-binding domain-containing protein
MTMFKIGDFSKLCRVPVSALRYYADIGLLEPAHIDTFTGFRFYTLDQLPRLNRILALKDLGLSLIQINEILHNELSASEILGMLKLKEHELQQEIEETQARLLRVRTRLQHIERQEQGLPAADVVLKEVPEQTVLSLRQIIAVGNMVADLFMECVPVIMTNQVELTGAPMTIFHDGEFKEADLDVEIVFPVTQGTNLNLPLADNRTLKTRTLEAIPIAATIIHKGDYSRFPETYELIGRWIESNQYQICGVSREIYLRPPGNDEAITEIQFPIERIK